MKKLFSAVIYENPLPQLRSRQSAFPGLAILPDGKILATHQIGEAFESVDGTTYISESADGGKTFGDSVICTEFSGDEVTYSILPHTDDFRAAGVIEEAEALNRPLLTRTVKEQKGIY